MITRNNGGDGNGANLAGFYYVSHVAPLDNHLCRRLQLPSLAGTVDAEVLVESRPEVSENVCHQLLKYDWRGNLRGRVQAA